MIRLSLLLLLLIPVASPAAESPDAAVSVVQTNLSDIGPGHVRIEGPERGHVGQAVSLVVRGLPEMDLGKTIGEQLEWMKTVRFVLDAPDGVELVIDDELVMTTAPLSWRMRLLFTPPASGTYLLIFDWNEPPFGLAVHRIEIRGPPGPSPDPTPGPDPQPGPGPVNPYPAPAQSVQEATAAIRAIPIARPDATALGQLYADAQRLVASAPAAIAAGTKPEIGTTSELRAWLVQYGRELGLQGKYAGLADAVDRYLGQSLGTSIRNVTAADADVLGGLAWAVWEAGR
jgi:hypothetical protein